MPIIIKLQDIDEAIENLHYKNETTLKSRLLRAVRQYYSDDSSAESLQTIDAEELVKTVWETGDDRDLLKTKRKNFSSLKSSVNSDLKKLYVEGKNPQGIVIGPDNIFAISNEAKDKALAGIMDVFKEKGIDTQSKVSEILSALSEILSTTTPNPDAENTKEEIDRLKNILGDISGKLGLSLQDIIRRTAASDSGDLSMIDKGLQGLAMEAAKAAAGIESAHVKESVTAAFTNIVQVLKDAETDAEGKAKKIMAAVEGMLSEAIDASGEELSGDQAGKIKEIFHEIIGGREETQAFERPETDKAATPAQMAGGELLETVSSILGDGGLSHGDKIGKIMSAVNEMIGEALACADTGLSDEDKAHIREMMANITGNLDALGQEALAGFDIVEEEVPAEEGDVEIVEEIAVPPAEVVDGDAAGPAVEIEEMVEAIDTDVVTEDADISATDETVEIDVPPAEVVEEGLESVSGTEEFAEELDLAAAANADLLEEIAEATFDESVGELVEIIEEIALPPDEVTEEDLKTGTEETIDMGDAGLSPEEMADLASLATSDEAALPPDEVAEIVEEVISETAEGSDVAAEETDAPAALEEGVEFVDAGIDDTAVEVVEEILDEAIAAESQTVVDAAEIEAIDQSADQDFVEEVTSSLDVVDLPPDEVVEETDDGASNVQVTPDDKNIDDDLREKTDLLTRLAQAAGELTAMGPDLSGSIYTEEQIRGKAKFLSEEFDRYLSIRDRFYNAHILIKGGDYLVGGAHLAKSELEEQIVTLQDFYISKFPVTNALFEIFVEQTGYITTAEKYGFGLVYFPRMQRSRDPVTGVERFSLHNQAYSKKVPGACWHRPFGPGSSLHLKRTHPVVQVSVEDARAFAVWTGKRLPTEIEWEAAARTMQGLRYPWGNQWQDDACNIEKSLHGDTSPVDKYAKFANSTEVADMLGNVLEWTCDTIGDRETADTYIAKGASWISHGEISLTDRHYIEMNAPSNILGFRCVAI